jgi:hypothetical protein
VSDLYEPYEKLIPIEVMGKTFQVPENNLLLRQMAFVAADIAWGRYCWNGECRYCEVHYRRDDGPELAALACRARAGGPLQLLGGACGEGLMGRRPGTLVGSSGPAGTSGEIRRLFSFRNPSS